MKNAPTLRSVRLRIEPVALTDAPEMAEVLGDPQLHEFIGDKPLTLDELRRRYARLLVGQSADGKETWFNWIVRLKSGTAVGTLQATLTSVGTERHAEIAWVIGVPWQRQGIASEATCALVEWLELDGVRVISANVHPLHVASQKVAARAGLAPTDELVEREQVWRRVAAR